MDAQVELQWDAVTMTSCCHVTGLLAICFNKQLTDILPAEEEEKASGSSSSVFLLFFRLGCELTPKQREEHLWLAKVQPCLLSCTRDAFLAPRGSDGAEQQPDGCPIKELTCQLRTGCSPFVDCVWKVEMWDGSLKAGVGKIPTASNGQRSYCVRSVGFNPCCLMSNLILLILANVVAQ